MRSCSAEAPAEFFDCFFDQPDDDADNDNPGDQDDTPRAALLARKVRKFGNGIAS